MNLPAIAPAPADYAAVIAGWHAAERSIFQDLNDAADNSVICALIEHLIAIGEPFSSNTLRDLGLPAVRNALISRRFIDFQRAGRIEKCGYTPSTLASTKGHPVAVYAPTEAAS